MLVLSRVNRLCSFELSSDHFSRRYPACFTAFLFPSVIQYFIAILSDVRIDLPIRELCLRRSRSAESSQKVRK